jgi:hypothetical protein
LCIDETGHYERGELIQSTGLPAYDAQIARAMMQWVYRPYIVDGVAIPVCSQITFVCSQARGRVTVVEASMRASFCVVAAARARSAPDATADLRVACRAHVDRVRTLRARRDSSDMRGSTQQPAARMAARQEAGRAGRRRAASQGLSWRGGRYWLMAVSSFVSRSLRSVSTSSLPFMVPCLASRRGAMKSTIAAAVFRAVPTVAMHGHRHGDSRR